MNSPESPSHSQRPPGFGVRRTTTQGSKTSSPALVFERILRAFETGSFAYTDVLAELKLLLAAGASATELLEILQRRELIEPLPEFAHVEVLGLLDDAIARAAAEAVVSGEPQNADSNTSPDQTPESGPAPTRSTSRTSPIERADGPAKAKAVVLTSVFAKVMSTFGARAFTDADVLAQLKQLLLTTGASPNGLLEILRRRELIEALPENAYVAVLDLLNDGAGPAASMATPNR